MNTSLTAWIPILFWTVMSLGCQKAPPPDPVKDTCTGDRFTACERDCHAGDDQACESAEAIYLRLDGTGSPRLAALMQRLCDGGRKRFCPTYAFCLAEGAGVAKDEERARQLFESTCEFDPTSCSEFGSLFAAGTGIPKDLDIAHLLLELACKNLDKEACRELDEMLEAVCKAGHGASCNQLAVRRSESVGHEPDSAEVARLFRLGCDADDGPACRNLALATENGLGTEKDLALADRLYTKACKLGSTDACNKKHR